MKGIIGRYEEQKTIQTLLTSKRSEFLALYGRRRVGKTFLVREYFQNRFAFYLTGIANANTDQQLLNFDLQLQRLTGLELQRSANWIEAFYKLRTYLSQQNPAEKQVLFFDELPWLDTNGSDFIQGLEHFWNNWADGQKNIFLIVCGSAASWMISNLIHTTGGLHNRLTNQMKIQPFTLKETADFFQNKAYQFTQHQVVLLYMTMGGIPYYLEQVPSEKSAAQAIQHLFFDKNAKLQSEFNQLYRALFRKHEIYEKVVEILSSKALGFTRTELVQKGQLQSGGTLSKVLFELEESGFITSYPSLDNKAKNTVYRLSDFYTAFYFQFLKNYRASDDSYWLNIQNQPVFNAWKGIAFEQVCLSHVPQIKKALGISGVLSKQGAWIGAANDQKAQVDLLIDRQDQVINLCECKFSNDDFTIDKDYAAQLRRKMEVFRTATKTKKAVWLTFITTYGLQTNAYSNELVQKSIAADALFES